MIASTWNNTLFSSLIINPHITLKYVYLLFNLFIKKIFPCKSLGKLTPDFSIFRTHTHSSYKRIVLVFLILHSIKSFVNNTWMGYLTLFPLEIMLSIHDSKDSYEIFILPVFRISIISVNYTFNIMSSGHHYHYLYCY